MRPQPNPNPNPTGGPRGTLPKRPAATLAGWRDIGRALQPCSNAAPTAEAPALRSTFARPRAAAAAAGRRVGTVRDTAGRVWRLCGVSVLSVAGAALAVTSGRLEDAAPIAAAGPALEGVGAAMHPAKFCQGRSAGPARSALEACGFRAAERAAACGQTCARAPRGCRRTSPARAGDLLPESAGKSPRPPIARKAPTGRAGAFCGQAAACCARLHAGPLEGVAGPLAPSYARRRMRTRARAFSLYLFGRQPSPVAVL